MPNSPLQRRRVSIGLLLNGRAEFVHGLAVIGGGDQLERGFIRQHQADLAAARPRIDLGQRHVLGLQFDVAAVGFQLQRIGKVFDLHIFGFGDQMHRPHQVIAGELSQIHADLSRQRRHPQVRVGRFEMQRLGHVLEFQVA